MKTFKYIPRKIRQLWKKLFTSTKERNMSRGASNVDKIITWAHKDNWRRKEKKK